MAERLVGDGDEHTAGDTRDRRCFGGKGDRHLFHRLRFAKKEPVPLSTRRPETPGKEPESLGSGAMARYPRGRSPPMANWPVWSGRARLARASSLRGGVSGKTSTA